MHVTGILKYGLILCAFYCTVSVSPSFADICFLPTGECEQAVLTKRPNTDLVGCETYINTGRYYRGIQMGMVCIDANIPQCPDMYECTVTGCEENGYKLKGTTNKNSWPAGYDRNSWACESCLHLGKYFWKCTPSTCQQPYVTRNACTETQTFRVVDNAGYSGKEKCGECIENSALGCGNGLVSQIPFGCYTCEKVKTTGNGGIACYKCREMSGGYVTETVYNSRYDSSCYDHKSKRAADGGLCYKHIEKECPQDQYRAVETFKGKDICKCRDYEYAFELGSSSMVISASGGTVNIPIISTRTGNETVYHDYSTPSNVGDCSISKSGTGVLTVSCPANYSQSSDKVYSFKITQTKLDEVTVNELTVSVTVEKDSCPVSTQFGQSCDSGYEAEKAGTSATGADCYKCSKKD